MALSPEGRIGPATFRNEAMILIAIGALFSLMPAVISRLWMASFVSLLLVYPWLMIWVERLHDAGKPGRIFFGILVVWLIVGGVASSVVTSHFAPTPVPPASPGNFSGVMATVATQMQASAIPGTITSVIVSLAFVFIGNALLKSNPGPNAYGPPPAP